VGAHVPIMIVTDMYYLDRFTDMVILLPLYLQLILALYIFWSLLLYEFLKFYKYVDEHSNNLLSATAFMLSLSLSLCVCV